MEIRRVRKYFYCNICNETFSKLVDPEDVTEVHCSNCNRTFVEMIERPGRFVRNNDSTKPLPAFAFWNQRLAPESLPPINRPHELERNGHRQPQFRVRQFNPQEESKGPNLNDSSRPIRFLVIELFNLNSLFSELNSGLGPRIQVSFEDFGNNFASNFDLEYIFHLGQLLSMQTSQPARPPASKEAVSNLPVFKLEKKHCKVGTNGKWDLPGCAICCSNIALGEECQLLPCGHMYHPACVKPWFDQNNTCPTCRYELPTDDPAYVGTCANNAPRRDIRRTESMNPQRRVPSRQVPVRPPSRHTETQQTTTLPSVNPKVNPNTQPKTDPKPIVRPNQRPAINPLSQSRVPPKQIKVHKKTETRKKAASKATPIITAKMIRKPKPNN